MNPRRHGTRRLAAATALLVALLGLAGPSPVRAQGHGPRYYLSLGDSVAASEQPNGDFTHGYAEQLHAMLAATAPKLRLVKLGCGGESTTSMRFGSQDPASVSSCGTRRDYRHLYPKATQLAQAVRFLKAHRGEVALVTIDIGANDFQHLDAQGDPVFCLFEPTGCIERREEMAENLASIINELRSAAGSRVPIVGMTYGNVFAPLGDPAVDAGVDAINAVIAATYEAAGIPVADVAGAFHNGEQPLSAQLVCRWTWFCSVGDIHPNTEGYAVIAQEFLEQIPQ